MNYDKITDELVALIAKIQAEINEHNFKLSKPYLKIFKEYDDTLDFEKYNFEVKVIKNYSHSIYEIIADIGDIGTWSSDKNIARIYSGHEHNEIYAVESNGRDSIDFDRGKDYIDYFMYAREMGIKLTKICFEHKEIIGQKLVKINSGDKIEYFTEKIAAANYMIKFMNNIIKHKITNKIWIEGGINLKDYIAQRRICVTSFGPQNKLIDIDSLEFNKNNTGTFNVYLKCNNNIVSSSTRCNNNTLELIIDTIAINMNDWNTESLKNL
jgi:hypothetical protein